jgi:hypothetical protein
MCQVVASISNRSVQITFEEIACFHQLRFAEACPDSIAFHKSETNCKGNQRAQDCCSMPQFRFANELVKINDIPIEQAPRQKLTVRDGPAVVLRVVQSPKPEQVPEHRKAIERISDWINKTSIVLRLSLSVMTCMHGQSHQLFLTHNLGVESNVEINFSEFR